MQPTRLWVPLAAVAVFLLVVIALPSSECDYGEHCVGERSRCRNSYCDCGHESTGYRCDPAHPVDWMSSYYYPRYGSYRGYGNGYSASTLVALVTCFVSVVILFWLVPTPEAETLERAAADSSVGTTPEGRVMLPGSVTRYRV